ncbi:MAG TPA: hypothetical protein VF170_20100, partial [Planctomycetaceae bacterium]
MSRNGERACVLAVLCCLATSADAAERTERFDADPGWEGRNNRAASPLRSVRQDFGYSPRTAHAGGRPGEIGGHIAPAAEPAWYAKPIEPKTFDDRLVASGRLRCEAGANHVLIGFFNSRTTKEWRTPNTVAIRLL